MEITLKNEKTKIIEMTIESQGTVITEGISDLNGFVYEELIYNLQDMVNALEDHNTEMSIREKLKESSS